MAAEKNTILCRCLALTAVLVAAMTVGVCASVPRIAVPTELSDQVEVTNAVGQDSVRVWGDADSPLLKREAANRLQQIKERRPGLLKDRNLVVSYLALSGGGSNGAFGSGLLNGWTANGTRPEFEIVSGVSTGALMAPFAFLGPSYDEPLREIYTEYSTRDLVRPQVLAGLVGGSSLTDTAPLRDMIAKYVDWKLLRAVADEHAKGRRLLVGTTNIDADRPVIWNMGQIAQRGTPEALELFRSVLLASAALPGLFPPVFVKVSADGKTYEEMHVDGGTTDNAFLIPQNANLKAFGNPGWKRKLYVIANDKTGPAPDATQATTMAIVGRSMATLIKQQLEGDLIKLYLRSEKNGVDYNEISIPSTFREKAKEAFDKEYMRKLYQLGYDMGKADLQWRKKPSGI